MPGSIVVESPDAILRDEHIHDRDAKEQDHGDESDLEFRPDFKIIIKSHGSNPPQKAALSYHLRQVSVGFVAPTFGWWKISEVDLRCGPGEFLGRSADALHAFGLL
jgi:hypothetical protein